MLVDSPLKNERRNVTNHPTEDDSRLVWKVLPSHAHFEKYGSAYFEYSKSTSMLLRHADMHASNGAVCFHKFARRNVQPNATGRPQRKIYQCK